MRIRDWSSDVCSSDLTIQVEVRKKRVFVKRDPAERVTQGKASAIESDEAVQPEAAAPVVAPVVGSEVAPRVGLDKVSAGSPAQEAIKAADVPEQPAAPVAEPQPESPAPAPVQVKIEAPEAAQPVADEAPQAPAETEAVEPAVSAEPASVATKPVADETPVAAKADEAVSGQNDAAAPAATSKNASKTAARVKTAVKRAPAAAPVVDEDSERARRATGRAACRARGCEEG